MYDKISTEFRSIFRVFVNFAAFRGSATTQKIRNPVFVFYLGTNCKIFPHKINIQLLYFYLLLFYFSFVLKTL